MNAQRSERDASLAAVDVDDDISHAERLVTRVPRCEAPRGNDVEWMMYGWSVLHCLPVGMAESPSAETGTVMRTDTLRRYACEAGFADVEVLPIENYFFRFYRLRS